MKNTGCIALILLFMVFACSKPDSGYRSSGATTVVIRGFEARDNIGNTLADIGNPDIRLHFPEGQSSNPDLSFISFPNPAKDVMEVYVHSKQKDVTARVWIVPASFEGAGSETMLFLGNTVAVPATRPLFDTTFLMTSNTWRLKLSSLPEGYYRVYLKSEGILLWDNIVFSNVPQYYQGY
jgi:hypothetical protein